MYFDPQKSPLFIKKNIDLVSNGFNILHVFYYDTVITSQHAKRHKQY